MQSIKNCWNSFKEKPIIYFVFILSIILCIFVSCAFYRMAKNQFLGIDPYKKTFFSMSETYDNVEFYDVVKNTSNVKEVTHFMYLKQTEEMENGQVRNFSIDHSIVYIGNDKTITKQELESGERLVSVGVDYASKYGVEIGDKIQVFDAEYKVVRKVDISGLTIYVSASAPIKFDAKYSMPYPGFIVKSTSRLKGDILGQFDQVGLLFMREDSFGSDVIMPIILGIVVMAIASINVAISYAYITKRNSKSFAVYKIVGAKNAFVARAMFLEALLSYFVAFVIATAIEMPIAKPLLKEFLTSLNIYDYLALFAINLVAILGVVTYRVAKFIIRKPAEIYKKII